MTNKRIVSIFQFGFIFFLLSTIYENRLALAETNNTDEIIIKIIDTLVKTQQSINRVEEIKDKKIIIQHKDILGKTEPIGPLVIYAGNQVEIIPVVLSRKTKDFDRHIYFINNMDQKEYAFFPLRYPLKQLEVLMPLDATSKDKEDLRVLDKLYSSYTGDIVHCLNIHFQTWERLVKMGEGIVPKVVEAIKDSDSSWIRSTLIAVLCEFIPEDNVATHAVIERLEDKDIGIQIIVAYRLGELQVKDALPLLRRKLTDDTYYYEGEEKDRIYPVRKAAKEAINKIMNSK